MLMRNASGFRLPPTAADIFSFAAEEATGRPPSASAKRLAIDPPFSRDRIETGREWIERQVSEFLNISTSSISKYLSLSFRRKDNRNCELIYFEN